MKTMLNTQLNTNDNFSYRFHSGEYQMLNGNGTDFDLSKIINFSNGIPGFEELSKFIVVPPTNTDFIFIKLYNFFGTNFVSSKIV